MRLGALFKLCFVVSGLCLVLVESKEPTAQDVADAYRYYMDGIYQQFIKQSPEFMHVSPPIAFAQWYEPEGVTPKVKAKVKRKILYDGFGVRGLSKTRKATKTEFTVVMAILKTIAPVLEDISAPKHENGHQSVITRGLRIFRKPPENPDLKVIRAWTDGLDPIVDVRSPDNPYIKADAKAVQGCIEFNYSLYMRQLYPSPRLDKKLSSLQEQFQLHIQELNKSLQPQFHIKEMLEVKSLEKKHAAKTLATRFFSVETKPLKTESEMDRELVIKASSQLPQEERDSFVELFKDLNREGMSHYDFGYFIAHLRDTHAEHRSIYVNLFNQLKRENATNAGLRAVIQILQGIVPKGETFIDLLNKFEIRELEEFYILKIFQIYNSVKSDEMPDFIKQARVLSIAMREVHEVSRVTLLEILAHLGPESRRSFVDRFNLLNPKQRDRFCGKVFNLKEWERSDRVLSEILTESSHLP